MTLAGRYHAFLSYAHEDKETVEWLHKLLSVFWVPWKGRRRIFFDRESLPADGGLSAKLTNALKDSSFLIVCCSIHSVESRWVNLEVIEFLKTHPAEKVLACLVGPKTAGPFAIPQAVQSLQERLKDDLFKPDLRDDPEKLKGRERKAATREALALLAPLVGLAGKDELLDQRRKNLIVGTVLLFVLASGGTGWKLWDDRPQSQINKILAASPDAVKAISAVMTSSKSASPQADIIAKDPATYRYSVIDEWLRTLVLTGHSKDALEAALTIERTDARLHAVTEIMEQLTEGGAIRHYIDHWGHPSWETVPDKAEGSAKAGAGDEAKLAVAVHAANEITETARKIAGAYSRFQVLLSVVDALGKAGKSSEAKVVAHEALEAGRKIEDADSRTWALAKLIETLPMAGQNEETTQIAAEALEAAQNIKDKDSHSKALARLGEALAAAGKSSEAVETASKIEDESSRSSALVGIVDGLVKAGRYGDARNAARQIKAAGERTKSLVSIVETLVKAGKSEEAKQVANEALEAFRQVKFGVQGRDTPSAQIIEMLAGIGRIDEALEMARRITNAGDRSRTLDWTIKALVKAGYHSEAARVATEAIAAALQIKDPDGRTTALIDITETLVNSGGSGDSSRIANEMLTAIPEHMSYWQTDQIVRLLARTGKDEAAKQVAERELVAIQELPPGEARSRALASPVILAAVAKSGTGAETRQVAHTVLEAAQQRKFEWEANRAPLLVNIVGALAQAGKTDEAVEAAGGIVNQITRVQALVRVAEELAKAREVKNAWSVITEAQHVAQQFTVVADKSRALSEVAKGLGRLRYFRLAREAVNSESSSSDKLAAYIVVMREYAIEQNPGLARLFEAEKPE